MSHDVTELEYMHTVHEQRLDVTITKPSGGQAKGKVLFLHGAGESTKHRCVPLARKLSELGWECLTFSFPGHGESSGSLEGSTLQGRKAVAVALAQELGYLAADMVVGISMGAHTAISMLKDYPGLTKKLILMVPAIYASAAENAPFGPKFSEVLHMPNSYMTAEPWQILPSFRGDLCVVQTGQDIVIPPVVIKRLLSDATGAKSVQHVLIAGSPHRISNWINDMPERIQDFATAMDAFDFVSLDKYKI